jgi:hypothetical protein
MTMPGDPDATMPVEGGPGAPGGPGGLGADATQPVTRAEYPGGPGGPGDGGQPPYDDEDDSNRRKLWMIAAGVLVLGLLVGVLVAVLASGGGDDDTPTTTTSSSTTSSTTTTTIATTTTPPAAGPSILQFNGSPAPYPCPGSGTIQLTWSTSNTTGVSINIDGGGVYGNYAPTGNAQVPFACPDTQHTYVLTANGTNGQKPQQTLVVQAIAAPTTTTTDP